MTMNEMLVYEVFVCLFVYVTHFYVELSLKFDRKNEFRGQTAFVMYA